MPSRANRLTGRHVRKPLGAGLFRKTPALYGTRRVQTLFLSTIEYVEDENLKQKLKDDYNNWRKTKSAKDFWKERNLEMNQTNHENSLPQPQGSDNASSSVTTATTTVDSIDTISFEDAKAIQLAETKEYINTMVITNDLNRGKISRIQADREILALIINNTDQVMIRLLQFVKSLAELLPLTNQKKEIKEFELCTRYLQPCFQKFFGRDQDQLMFKWLNTNCFLDVDAGPNKNRPDGVVKNDLMAVVYFEAGTINFKRKHIFQIMAISIQAEQ
ncbi:hypothetical protein BD770DRAFT_469854 [Pilaira anomala]|nr:hypothetical protein BD770DRAFT_469854 [Pilaira anomala]